MSSLAAPAHLRQAAAEGWLVGGRYVGRLALTSTHLQLQCELTHSCTGGASAPALWYEAVSLLASFL